MGQGQDPVSAVELGWKGPDAPGEMLEAINKEALAVGCVGRRGR